MYNVYLYLPETLADWEIGHITAELRSKRFFRADAPQVTLRTVGLTAESVLTMGGLRVVPDGTNRRDSHHQRDRSSASRQRTHGMTRRTARP